MQGAELVLGERRVERVGRLAAVWEEGHFARFVPTICH